MRIIAGSLGGRVLRAPTGAATRPTSEKVREALFQILGDVAGARVLDLFAGSGALGLEAVSRDAARVTFVDSARHALATIRDNLRELAVPAERVAVVQSDAVAYVKKLPADEVLDLVFIDPPYASDLAVRAATALPAGNLAPGAVVVIEHDRRNAPPDALGSLLRTDQRRYGDTYVSFYAKAEVS